MNRSCKEKCKNRDSERERIRDGEGELAPKKTDILEGKEAVEDRVFEQKMKSSM